MTKIRALITLVVGKGQELPPGGLYDLSDDEAKRLASLNFAEILGKIKIRIIMPKPKQEQTMQNPMKMAVDSLFNRLGQRAKYQNKDVLILVLRQIMWAKLDL